MRSRNRNKQGRKGKTREKKHMMMMMMLLMMMMMMTTTLEELQNVSNKFSLNHVIGD
jgi:hypothetical protein